MPRIDVRQLSQELDKVKTWLEGQKLSFENAQKSVKRFQVDTLAAFQGETGDSVRAYTQEIYEPIHIEMMKVEAELRPVLDVIKREGQSQFGDDGIVDSEYITEWSGRFDKYAHQLIDLTHDVNQDLRSVADIIDLELLKTDELEEIQHNIKRHCQRTSEQIDTFDRETDVKMASIQESIAHLQKMVQEASSKAPSMSTYKSGSFKFNMLSKMTPEEQKKYNMLPQELKDSIDAQPPILVLSDVTINTIDGNTYFTINKQFYYQDYGGKKYTAHFVFVEINGKVQMFLTQDGSKGMSVPFGVFHPDPFTSSSGWEDVDPGDNSDGLPKLVHYKSDPFPVELEGRRGELEEIARYYSSTENCKNLGEAMLKYKGNQDLRITDFNSDILNRLAGQYSGSSGERNFYEEIEAHADLLISETPETNAIRIGMLVSGKKKSNEEFFNSVGCADMAQGDTNYDKQAMDFLWGNQIVKGGLQEVVGAGEIGLGLQELFTPFVIVGECVISRKNPLEVMGSGKNRIRDGIEHRVEGAGNIVQGIWDGIKGVFN